MNGWRRDRIEWAKYLQRSCPKCNGYWGIVVPERKDKMSVQAINGRCLKCGYRLAWVLIRGKTSAILAVSECRGLVAESCTFGLEVITAS